MNIRCWPLIARSGRGIPVGDGWVACCLLRGLDRERVMDEVSRNDDHAR